METYNTDIIDLIEFSKKLEKFVVGFEGNISKKLKEGIIIKASGKNMRDLNSESDFVIYNNIGQQISNHSNKGSIETDFHRYLLSYEEINYVCHTHPINTLKVLCSNESYNFSQKRLFPDQIVFNGTKSLLIPYVKPGIDLKKKIETYINKWMKKNIELPKLILLENHGIITFGKTVQECVIKTEICEKSAEIFLGFSNRKKISFMKKKEIKKISKDSLENYRISKL